MSSTFYEQLLHTQIPKVQKRQSSCQSFFALLGSAHVKSVHTMLMKLIPGVNIYTGGFYTRSSPKRKNSVKLSVSFYAYGICARKICSYNVDETDTLYPCSSFSGLMYLAG